jgi:hypothetical protein
MTIHFNIKKNNVGYRLSGFFHDEQDVEEVVEFLSNLKQKVQITIDYNKDNCFLWFGAIIITIFDDVTLALLKLATNIRFHSI